MFKTYNLFDEFQKLAKKGEKLFKMVLQIAFNIQKRQKSLRTKLNIIG